jgi:hypothetical protein
VDGSNIRYASGNGRLLDTNSRPPKSTLAPAPADGHESPAGAEAAQFLPQLTTVQNSIPLPKAVSLRVFSSCLSVLHGACQMAEIAESAHNGDHRMQFLQPP